MRAYILWYSAEGKNGAVMEVTKVVEDCHRIAPQLPRVMLVSAIMEIMQADEVITAETEEEMMALFENATIISQKEVH